MTTLTTARKGRIIIFLDIDGVLLPFPRAVESTCGAIFPDEAMVALTTILEAYPTAELVLSSTWRAQGNLIAEILHSFELYGKAFGGPLQTIKAFDDITDPNFHSERQHEIYKYLFENDNSNYNNVLAWVALDDEELLEGKVNEAYKSKFEGRVVNVNSRIGLTSRDALMAMELLRKQLAQ